MKEEKLRYYIEKCSLKYDNKYSYNGINPRNCKEEFELKCPIHGVFSVRASHFLNQLCQCPKCGKHKYTKNEFIEKANIIHNSKYDYSKIEYINNHTKVSIICPIHGEFRQTPSAHLNGNACPKCNGGCVMTKEEFVEKSQQIHGNKYCYNNVEYINSKTTVKIICNKHGIFEQMPMLHLKGCGCPKCKSSKLEQIIIIQLDKHNIEYIPQYRVKIFNEHIFDFYLR